MRYRPNLMHCAAWLSFIVSLCMILFWIGFNTEYFYSYLLMAIGCLPLAGAITACIALNSDHQEHLHQNHLHQEKS